MHWRENDIFGSREAVGREPHVRIILSVQDKTCSEISTAPQLELHKWFDQQYTVFAAPNPTFPWQL